MIVRTVSVLFLTMTAVTTPRSARPDKFEIGGPLAGVRLPLFATQHGEEPGYPGCIPELIREAKTVEDMGNAYRQWGPQGQAPQWQIYDGSVEHWRAYMFKYLPVRSFFDRQSQLKNWAAAMSSTAWRNSTSTPRTRVGTGPNWPWTATPESTSWSTTSAWTTCLRARHDRLHKDADIWNAFPPVNAQGSSIRVGHGGYGSIQGVRAGTDKLTGEQIDQRYGRWAPPGKAEEMNTRDGEEAEAVFLTNSKLDLVYTYDDLRNNRPLPNPYPLQDDGAGLYFSDADNPDTGAAWTPIGARVHDLYREYYYNVGRSLAKYKKSGDPNDAHDAAITLVRFAHAFPTLDFSEYLSNTVHDPGPFGRDASCRRRFAAANFLPR